MRWNGREGEMDFQGTTYNNMHRVTLLALCWQTLHILLHLLSNLEVQILHRRNELKLIQWQRSCMQHKGYHLVHMITHHLTLQGSSKSTGSPKAYSVPFTSQLSMGTQVMLGQHSPGILSPTALVPKEQSTSGQGWKTGYRLERV